MAPVVGGGSYDIERALAGIALCPDNEAALVAFRSANLSNRDFTTAFDSVVLAAIDLHAKGRPVELLTVKEQLTPESLERLGGWVALNRILDDAPPVERVNDLLAALLRSRSGFPSIISAASFTAEPMPEPAQVIHGVLHAGSKAVYGGPSKAFKSWSLLDMSLAVSTGGDWLGFATTEGRVLYVNFELQPFALHRRLHALANARGCRITDNLDLWNLRGHGCPMTKLLPDLLRRVEGEGYALIIPDPIYKTLDGRNENDAGDIGGLCGELEAVAVQTGAAVAFGAHFAKGNAGGKEAIDRVSGSGVWARDPDAIITATPHEEDSAFTVEMTLRNFAPPSPFVIRWEYPRMIRDGQLDPDRLRRPKNGRPATYTTADIMQHLQDGMTSSKWQAECKNEGGISMQSFYRLMGSVKHTGEAVKDGRGWKRGSI
jgi:hypothetical protein